MKAIVNNSTCRIVSREKLTRGTVGKTMEAEFSDDWAGLAITATFEAGDIKKDWIYTEDPITIPHEVLATAGVSVMLGFHGALEDGTIVKRTEKEWLNNVSETLDPAGAESSEPTPDWTAQVQNIAKEAKEVADSVRNDADAGKFKGPAGEAGGWYTPEVTQPDTNTMRMSFTPSKEGMPAVEPTDIALPKGSSEGGSVSVDDTLTVQGAAADAKATGDAINKLSEDIANIPSGNDGKSAYQYAKEGGFSGTEEEFAAKLAKDYLPLSGGRMTGKIVLPTGNQDVGFSNSEDVKILGYGPVNDVMHMRIGDTKYPFQIRGSGDRPKYNDSELVLKSEFEDIMGSYITDIDTLIGGDE